MGVGIDLWEGLGYILFVDSEMVDVEVALDGDRIPGDIGSSASWRVSQMCSGCTTWGILDEDRMVGLIVLALIYSVVDGMDVVSAELEILVAGQPGTKWR